MVHQNETNSLQYALPDIKSKRNLFSQWIDMKLTYWHIVFIEEISCYSLVKTKLKQINRNTNDLNLLLRDNKESHKRVALWTIWEFWLELDTSSSQSSPSNFTLFLKSWSFSSSCCKYAYNGNQKHVYGKVFLSQTTSHNPHQSQLSVIGYFTSSAHRPRNSAVISWAKSDHITCLCTAVSAFFRNLLLSRAILACVRNKLRKLRLENKNSLNILSNYWMK